MVNKEHEDRINDLERTYQKIGYKTIVTNNKIPDLLLFTGEIIAVEVLSYGNKFNINNKIKSYKMYDKLLISSLKPGFLKKYTISDYYEEQYLRKTKFCKK